MAIALVQTKSATSTFASTTVTWNSNTTTGNLIVVAIISSGSLGNVSSVTDSQSNTYTRVNDASSSAEIELWYAKNITGGTTPTVTVAYTASTFNAAIAREYSGLSTASPLDQNATNTGVSNSPSSGSVTTTQASELLVGVSGLFGLTAVYTAGSGYGNLTTIDNSNRLAMEDQIVSSTGSYAGTFSLDASATWTAVLATFKALGQVVVSDNITATDTIPSYYSDLVDMMETVKATLESNVNVSENITVTESLSLLLSISTMSSDNVAVTEALNVTLVSDVRPSDNIAVTESVQRLLESNRTVSDSITTSESNQIILVSLVNPSDNITISESFKLLDELNINKSDSVTITEVVSASIPLTISISDNITITESKNATLVHNAPTSDNVTLSEFTDQQLSVTIVTSENIVVSESAIVSTGSLIIQSSDNITVTESRTVALLIGVNVEPANSAYTINSVKVI